MPLIRWMNRHGWIFSLTGLLCTAGALYLAVPPLLRWGNSGSFFLWLLETFFVTVIILALCYVPLRGFRILRLFCTAVEVNVSCEACMQTLDPEPLVAVCRELQAAWLRTLPQPSLHPTVQMMLSIALNELGQSQAAEQELNLILSAYEQYAPEIKIRIESIAVFVKLKAGKLEDARSYLTEMAYHVDKLQNDAVRKTWQGILQNRECLYRLLTEGGSEELLSAYRQELTGCKDLHDQVVTRMNIARCLLDLGRGDEARSHLEFVAQNGGKLVIRAEAWKRLAELDGAVRNKPETEGPDAPDDPA